MSLFLIAITAHPGHIEHIVEHAANGSWWIAVVAGFVTLVIILEGEVKSDN